MALEIIIVTGGVVIGFQVNACNSSGYQNTQDEIAPVIALLEQEVGG